MSLFEAYNQQQAQQSYAPQQRANLQTAYNQALGQRTPNWAIHLSNAMPSIAEIIAAGTTKGAFNQGRIADSLERQKNRQIAYTQALQNMEDNRVKDYVQMAKDQLNLDIADEERAYNRDLTKQQIAYKKLQDELAQKNYEKEQEAKAKSRAEDVDFRERTFKWQQEEAERKRKEAQEQAQREAEAKALAEQQKQEEAELKKKEEKIKQTQSLLNSFNSAGSIEPKDYLILMKKAEENPDEVLGLLQDSGNYKESGLILGFLPWKTAGNKNKFKLGINLDNKNTKGL